MVESKGQRDRNLLQSAIAQPQAMFSGNYLHSFPHEMAAAYMFHLVQNHPFVDGNKRTGAASAIVFLAMNDIEIDNNEQGLVDLTIQVATGQADRQTSSKSKNSFARTRNGVTFVDIETSYPFVASG